LSSGGFIAEAEDAGTGVGVGHLVNGLEEAEEVVLDGLDSTELPLSVLDCRDFRRKGTEGRRYVGNTAEKACVSRFFLRNDIVVDSGSRLVPVLFSTIEQR
jgi:hypothetical protein